MALVMITAIAVLGFSFLQITAGATRRQAADVDRLEAFYLAEAGLADAFQAVRMGRTGQIASEAEPAAYGEGLVWVDAVDTAEGQVRLTSTGLVGRGRASLSLILEPVEIPLGFFSDEDLVVDEALLIDGFNSDEGTYEEALAAEAGGGGTGTGGGGDPEPTSELQLYADWLAGAMGPGVLIEYLTGRGAPDARLVTRNTPLTQGEAETFVARYWELRTAYESGDVVIAEPEPEPDATVLRDGGGGGGFESYSSLAVTEDEPIVSSTIVAEPVDDYPTHTSFGGLLGSNGDIYFTPPPGSPVEIYGDVVPGPEGSIVGLEAVTVTGEARPRSEVVDVVSVVAPEVPMEPATRHDGLLPLVVSPGSGGYERIEVAAGAELVLRGPVSCVIGELVLEPGALLTTDTRLGPVELFVTTALDLQVGSSVVTGESPSDVSIQVAAIPTGLAGAPVRLDALSRFHGTLYAPETDVHVGGDFEVFGGIVAKKLQFGAGARLHFDSARYEGGAIPRIIAWRIVELPASVRMGSDAYRVVGMAPGDAVRLADAHDLSSVQLRLDYRDAFGALQSYTGAESAFDWTQVAEIVRVERSTTRPRDTEPFRDPVAEEPAPVGRTEVFDAIATLRGTELSTYLTSMAPLSGDEYVAMADAMSMRSYDTAAVLTCSDPLPTKALKRLVTEATMLSSTDLKAVLEYSSPLPTEIVDLLGAVDTAILSDADRLAVIAVQ